MALPFFHSLAFLLNCLVTIAIKQHTYTFIGRGSMLLKCHKCGKDRAS